MKKALAALAAAGIAAASLIALAPTASAAGCVTTEIKTGYRGPGWVAYKAANTGCNDLNVVSADDMSGGFRSDNYAGYYQNSSGTWTQGSRGYIYLGDFTYALGEVVLVSDLTPGRAFSVASWYDGGDYVQIAH